MASPARSIQDSPITATPVSKIMQNSPMSVQLQIRALERSIVSYKARVDELEGDLYERELVITKLSSQIEGLLEKKDRLKEANTRIPVIEEENEQLNEKVQLLTMQLDQIRRKIDQYRDERDEMTQKLEKSEYEAITLAQRLDLKEEDFVHFKKKHESCYEENNGLRQEISQLKREVFNLENVIRKQAAELDQYQADMAQNKMFAREEREKEIEQLVSTYNETQQESARRIRKLEDDLQETRNKLEEADLNYQRYRTEACNFVDEYKILLEDIRVKDDQIKNLTNEKNRLTSLSHRPPTSTSLHSIPMMDFSAEDEPTVVLNAGINKNIYDHMAPAPENSVELSPADSCARFRELRDRNRKLPPHMRCSYAVSELNGLLLDFNTPNDIIARVDENTPPIFDKKVKDTVKREQYIDDNGDLFDLINKASSRRDFQRCNIDIDTTSSRPLEEVPSEMSRSRSSQSSSRSFKEKGVHFIEKLTKKPNENSGSTKKTRPSIGRRIFGQKN